MTISSLIIRTRILLVEHYKFVVRSVRMCSHQHHQHKKIKRTFKMDFAIVDLQGFRDDSNNFIVKELSFLTQNIKFSDIVESPFAFDSMSARSQKTAQWLTDSFHGLRWDDGYISVSNLRKTILPILRNKIIYVKGEEKIHWLRNILEDQEKKNFLDL